MNILMIGDICGRPGRQAAAQFLPQLKREYPIDFIVANGENAAGGNGVTAAVLAELCAMGVDVITSGNHIWDKKEIFTFIDATEQLIRPANYPPQTPGRGYTIAAKGKWRLGVVNLAGRSFMPAIDCPFRAIDEILPRLAAECDAVAVDFHAETTAEKMAMGWYLDGRVACVAGTHTHVQTADARILPQGTAYITDLGMAGPWHSVLGVTKETVIKKFITGLPARFDVANGPGVFSAIWVKIDARRGQALEIVPILRHE